jgi:hypothetical protein
MSIRSEAAGAVPVPPTASVAALDLSANATATACMPDNHVAATVDAARAADSALGEANAISTNHPDHPCAAAASARPAFALRERALTRRRVRTTGSSAPLWLPSAPTSASCASVRGAPERAHRTRHALTQYARAPVQARRRGRGRRRRTPCAR